MQFVEDVQAYILPEGGFPYCRSPNGVYWARCEICDWWFSRASFDSNRVRHKRDCDYYNRDGVVE